MMRPTDGKRQRSRHCLPPLDPLVAGVPLLHNEESGRYREPMSDVRWHALVERFREWAVLLHRPTLNAVIARIFSSIRWLDGPMERYCRLTADGCEDRCCEGREIFYNRADLLCMALSDRAPPPGQTRTRAGDPCRYLTPRGCVLDRIMRPYVCVWFMCEPHVELLQQEPAGFQRRFLATLADVRDCRLRLESLFQALPGSDFSE